MGPTNVALVKLSRADQALREAQERLDAAAKGVRVQERRVHDLEAKLKAAQLSTREQQAKAGNLDLDLKSRDAHINKLRTRQQTAHNNKEYQAILVEISTLKVDRTKVEEETLVVMSNVEKGQAEVTALTAALATEQAKLVELKAQSGDQLAKLAAEVEEYRPARDAAAAAVPPKAREAFERLAEHHDGEALAAIAKPKPRQEEYICTSCNMDLVVDVYNKLHSRDELIFCPSCRRILYIPEDLPPEAAIGKTKPAMKKVTAVTKKKTWSKEEFFERVSNYQIAQLYNAQQKLLSDINAAAKLTPKFEAKTDETASYGVFITGIKKPVLSVRADGTFSVSWIPLSEAGSPSLAEDLRKLVRPIVKDPDNSDGSDSGDASRLPHLDIDTLVNGLESIAKTVVAPPKSAANSSAADPDVIEIEQRAKGKLGQVLNRAQDETVRSAAKAGEKPVECEIYIDGNLVGIYKGQSADKLERAVKYFLGEAKMPGEVRVQPVPQEAPVAETPVESAAASEGSTEESFAGASSDDAMQPAESAQEPPAV